MTANSSSGYLAGLFYALFGAGAIVLATNALGILSHSIFTSVYHYQLTLVDIDIPADDHAIKSLRDQIQTRFNTNVHLLEDTAQYDVEAKCDAPDYHLEWHAKNTLLKHILQFRQLSDLADNVGLYLCSMNYQQYSTAYRGANAMLWGSAPVALFLFWMIRRSSKAPDRRVCWQEWNPLIHKRQAITYGIATAICMFLVSWLLHGFLSIPEPQWVSGTHLDLWALAPLAIVVAPFVEEYAFRAWLQERTRKIVGPVPALTVSTILFTIAHLPNGVSQLLVIVAMGLILGIAWHLTRSLITCVTAHGLYNACVLYFLI